MMCSTKWQELPLTAAGAMEGTNYQVPTWLILRLVPWQLWAVTIRGHRQSGVCAQEDEGYQGCWVRLWLWG